MNILYSLEISRSLYRSPIGRYLGCFQFGAFRNKAALNAVVHVVSFLLGKLLGVELLCRVIPVCETLSGTVKIPKVLVPFSDTVSGFRGFQGVPYPCQSRTSRETEREECWDMANKGGVWIGGPWDSLGASKGEREAPGAQAGSCTMWDQMWDPNEIMWDTSAVWEHSSAGREGPPCCSKGSCQHHTPTCSLRSCTPVLAGCHDQGSPHSTDEETKS